jgi:hypothetical protein
MYQTLGTLLSWLFFWGATAATLVFDDRCAKAAAKRSGSVDFVERRIRAYVLAAFFLGALVLVLYFLSSRKSLSGALLGVGVLLATLLATLVVSAGFSKLGLLLDHAAMERACASVVAGTDGDECDPDPRSPDRMKLLEIGCRAGGVSPCLWRGDDLFQVPGTPQSEWWARAGTLCARRPASVPRGRCDVLDVPPSH